MSATDGHLDVDRVKSVAEHDAKATPDDPDEQTLAGEQAHDKAGKKAKTAAVRAEEAEEKHVASLNRRIDVLQSKLDRREGDLHHLLPRTAELEQAARTSKVGAIVEAAGVGGGALLLSIASFTPPDEWHRFVCIGAGISASVFALSAKALLAAFGWPPKTTHRT